VGDVAQWLACQNWNWWIAYQRKNWSQSQPAMFPRTRNSLFSTGWFQEQI